MWFSLFFFFLQGKAEKQQKYLCHKETYNLKLDAIFAHARSTLGSISFQNNTNVIRCYITSFTFISCLVGNTLSISGQVGNTFLYITGQKKPQEHGGLMICPENGDHTDERHSPPSWISFSDKLVPSPTKKLLCSNISLGEVLGWYREEVNKSHSLLKHTSQRTIIFFRSLFLLQF